MSLMSRREFIALGTSSQVPTRDRNHNSCLLLWDGEGFLFDPGEGTQRQLTLAGVGACAIHHIGISHFHGDHCLGLAGVVQRLSLDHCEHPVHVYYPQSGQDYLDRLCNASVYRAEVELVFHPVAESGGGLIELCRGGHYVLATHALEHSIPAIGFRLEELEGLSFLPDKLEAAGVRGPLVGELERQGAVQVGGRVVCLGEVTRLRPGSAFAFVMDTRPCPGAAALAREADLLVMEATYASEHQELAERYRHCTSADAARTALKAGARALGMTHFSQRYADTQGHLREAREIFANSVALNDLDRFEIARRSAPPEGQTI